MVKTNTGLETVKKRIEYVEEQLDKVTPIKKIILRACLDALDISIRKKLPDNIELEYQALKANCHAAGIKMSIASGGLSEEDQLAVEMFSAKHKGGPTSWTPDQIKYLAMVNRPSKKGNITSGKKALEFLTSKCNNNLARVAKNNLWKIGNATIKAPPAPAPPPTKEKTVIIQEVPQEGI